MAISNSIREIMNKGSWIRQMFEEGARLKDLHVRVVVETPTKLSARQKDLLKEFDDCCDQESNPIQESFVESIKNLFS